MDEKRTKPDLAHNVRPPPGPSRQTPPLAGSHPHGHEGGHDDDDGLLHPTSPPGPSQSSASTGGEVSATKEYGYGLTFPLFPVFGGRPSLPDLGNERSRGVRGPGWRPAVPPVARGCHRPPSRAHSASVPQGVTPENWEDWEVAYVTSTTVVSYRLPSSAPELGETGGGTGKELSRPSKVRRSTAPPLLGLDELHPGVLEQRAGHHAVAPMLFTTGKAETTDRAPEHLPLLDRALPCVMGHPKTCEEPTGAGARSLRRVSP